MCNQGCIAPGIRPMWSATLIGMNFLTVTASNSTVAKARMLARPLFPLQQQCWRQPQWSKQVTITGC